MQIQTFLIGTLSVLAACVHVTPAAADTGARPNEAESSFIIQWDNDVFSGTDRNYTNGARVAYFQTIETDTEAHNFLQRSLRQLSGVGAGGWLGDRRFDRENGPRYAWGIGLTQLMFTPEDPDALAAPEGERPYAGWLGIEFILQANDADSANSITLSIGTTGSNSLAEDAQEWVHTNITDSPIFQGWDSQVPGEATLNLNFDRKQAVPFPAGFADGGLELDGYFEWGAALGNFRTNAYLGTLLRLGYNLPATYATPRVQIGSSSQYLFDPRPGQATDRSAFSIYAFGGLRGYGVLHDITLDGPVFRDFDTGVASEPWVGEFIYGVSLKFHGVDLGISHTIGSDEFKDQAEGTEYGSINLQLTHRF